MKRIALAVEDGNGLESNISSHFGQCREYLLLDMEGGEIIAQSTVENPFFGQHGACRVPGFIRDQKAEVMIAGGMGVKALNLFDRFGIEVVTGAAGNAGEALKSYLEGRLKGYEPCEDHDRGGCRH